MRTLALALFAFAVTPIIMVSGCSKNQSSKPNLVQGDAPTKEAMAKVNGEVITLEDLVGDAKVEFIRIKKEEHKFLMDRLNQVMKERLIGAEAKKAGMSLDEYIDKKIATSVKPSDADYKKFIKERQITEDRINPQLKEKIMSFLTEEKKKTLVDNYLNKLTKSSPVEIYFKKPKMNVQIDIAGAPTWGDANAPVTVVEFSDFECPYCSKGAKVVSQIKNEFKGKVKVAFRHFPLSFHKNAKAASEASMCVHEQSPDKFWKYHDKLFEAQDKLDKDGLETAAKAIGVDLAKYNDCVSSKKFEKLVQDDMSYGEKIGVRSTPTFFINGELVAGALPFEEFAKVINEAIDDSKKN